MSDSDKQSVVALTIRLVERVGVPILFCILLAWWNDRKDAVIKDQFQTQIAMTRDVNAALDKNTTAISALTQELHR
jgi:hypothetical protein